MKYNLTLIFLCVLSSLVSSQSAFEEKLQDIRENLDNIKLEESLHDLDQVRTTFKNKLDNCEGMIKLHRAYAYAYYHHWEDQKTININKDSILPLLFSCPGSDPNLIAQTYFNMGNQYQWLEKLDSTNIYFQKCIQEEKKLKTPGPFSGRHYLGIGDYFRKIGDLDKSLVYQLEAETLIQKSDSDDLHLNKKYLANVYRDKANYKLQEKYLNEAKSLLELRYLKKDHRDYSNIIEELAAAHFALNKNEEAIKGFKEAIMILSQNVPDYNMKLIDLNRTKKRLSYVYTANKEFNKALKLQSTLLRSYLNPENGFNEQDISGIKEDIGDTHYAAKDYSQALSEYQEAMQLMVRNLDTDVLKNPSILNNQITNKDFLRRQLGLKSKALYAAGLEKKDNSYFLSAIDAIQKYDTLVRMKLNQDFEEGSHQTLFDQSKEYYKYGILAAKELHSKYPTIENANYLYGFISKLKSQLLYRNIQQEEKQEKELTEDQVARKDTLEKQVSEKQLAIQTAEFNGDEAGYKTAINDYFDLKLEQESFLRELGLEDVLDLSDFIKTATIEEIQNKLDDKTAIIEYYLVDEKIIQVTIRKDHYNISTADFDAFSLIKLYGELSSGENATEHAEKDILGKMLDDTIPPAEIENLIIIPDEELLQFPFEILERDGQKLVNQYNISYEYGSAFLFDESSNTTGDEFVGFASDYNSPQFNLLNENYTYNTTGIKLSPLENAAKEIELSKASLGGSIFINQEATKEKFEGQAANSSILHLAMHGVLHERIPDLSALVFESEKEDFLLTASEIYNLDIPTNLTVLSACNSGVGPIQTGDGVRSLTRSFIHAGSESVITSLWEASDASTSQILTSFYKFLKEGKSKSESLRLAKLEYLEGASPTYQHPKYWAHLVLVGNTAPIFGASVGKLTFWIIVAMALLFVLVFLLRKVASKKSF